MSGAVRRPNFGRSMKPMLCMRSRSASNPFALASDSTRRCMVATLWPSCEPETANNLFCMNCSATPRPMSIWFFHVEYLSGGVWCGHTIVFFHPRLGKQQAQEVNLRCLGNMCAGIHFVPLQVVGDCFSVVMAEAANVDLVFCACEFLLKRKSFLKISKHCCRQMIEQALLPRFLQLMSSASSTSTLSSLELAPPTSPWARALPTWSCQTAAISALMAWGFANSNASKS